MSQKDQIRKKMMQRFPDSLIDTAAWLNNFSDMLGSYRAVALYNAFSYEWPMDVVLKRLNDRGLSVYVPRVCNGSLLMVHIKG